MWLATRPVACGGGGGGRGAGPPCVLPAPPPQRCGSRPRLAPHGSGGPLLQNCHATGLLATDPGGRVPPPRPGNTDIIHVGCIVLYFCSYMGYKLYPSPTRTPPSWDLRRTHIGVWLAFTILHMYVVSTCIGMFLYTMCVDWTWMKFLYFANLQNSYLNPCLKNLLSNFGHVIEYVSVQNTSTLMIDWAMHI